MKNYKGSWFTVLKRLQPSYIRLNLAVFMDHKFDIWTFNFRQIYLQSLLSLDQDKFLDNPPPEFEIQAHEYLQRLKPLYGLCEPGDQWHKNLDEHHRNELKINQFHTDSALYFIINENCLSGLSESCVDNMIRAGTSAFHKLSSKTYLRFDMSRDDALPYTF